MIMLAVAAMTALSVLPFAGQRGRARLARCSDTRLRAVHEQLLHRGFTALAGSMALVVLVLNAVRGDVVLVVLAAAGLALVAAAARAQPGALDNATAEMRERDLSPRVQRERSARRRRRQLQIGVSILVLYLVGNAVLLLDPAPALQAVASVALILAFFGVLALGIASVWVYGDEEVDEHSRPA